MVGALSFAHFISSGRVNEVAVEPLVNWKRNSFATPLVSLPKSKVREATSSQTWKVFGVRVKVVSAVP